MKKLFSVIFIILFLPFDLVAQQAFTVSGTIQDENKIALPFSMVYIESLKVSTTTDKEGRYQLMSVPIGKYELSARMIGYQSQSQSLTVTQNLVVDFTLSEESKGLEEVVITGRNQAVELFRSAQAVTVVETQAARLQTADLGEVIAQVQGVNVRRSGGLGSNTRFSLNGLTDHQVRFFLDGIPLDFMGYSFGIANVPVNLVDRVEIYKGVVPVRFGADALGGAVNLVSPKSFFNTSGAASYQVGSFGTHRATIDMQHQSSSSGFFIQSSAFLDAARNNYDIDVEVPDERGRLSEITVPRFHDDYLAWGVNAEAGWRDLKWAAQLSLSFFANQYTRDIQHNNVMTIPYGEVNSKVANYGGLLRWQNEWKSRLSLEVTSGYSYRQTSFQDTSIYFYNWFGERLRDDDGSLRIRPSGGEITFLPSDRRVWDDNYYARLLMKYSLNDNHQIRFSLAPTLVARTGDELRQVDPNAFDPLTSQRDVLTIISGVEYGWNSSDEKLENITFAKSYFQSLRAEEPIPGTVDGIQNRDRQSHDFGFGNSLRFHLNDQWILKASYEWATRLPRPREIFGDAVLIFDNLSLEPERSHNANLELNYQQSTPAHSDWSAGITGFLRQADNLIVLLGNDEVFQY
ncbi:MAG: TonB-dependent receptor plug domain-containing protein [Bacteroidota bacterium]